jgi:hypothetical protein
VSVRPEESEVRIASIPNCAPAGTRRTRCSATLGRVLIAAALLSCNDNSSVCCVGTITVLNSVAIAHVNGPVIPGLLVATTADQGQLLNPGFANVILNSKGCPGSFSRGAAPGPDACWDTARRYELRRLRPVPRGDRGFEPWMGGRTSLRRTAAAPR